MKQIHKKLLCGILIFSMLTVSNTGFCAENLNQVTMQIVEIGDDTTQDQESDAKAVIETATAQEESDSNEILPENTDAPINTQTPSEQEIKQNDTQDSIVQPEENPEPESSPSAPSEAESSQQKPSESEPFENGIFDDLQESNIPNTDIYIDENMESDVSDIDINDAQSSDLENIPVLLSVDALSGRDMTTARAKHTMLTINDELYAIGGKTRYSVPILSIERYSPETQVWTKITTMPASAGRTGSVSVAHDNKIYIIGGYLNEQYVSAVDVYDIAANTWSTVANLNIPRERCAAAVIGDEIYVFGGRNDTGLLKTGEKYNIQTGKWTAAISLPIQTMDASAFFVNGTVYVVGGFTAEGYSNSLYEYNVQTNRWTQKTSIPFTSKSMKAAFQYNSGIVHDTNNIYIAADISKEQKILAMYNTNTNLWTQCEIISDNIEYYNIGIIKDKLYVTGGTSYGIQTNTVDVYDIENIVQKDEWETVSNLRYVRGKAKAVELNGILYAIGGIRQGGNVNQIERFNETLSGWETVTTIPNSRRGYAVAATGDCLYLIGGYKNEMFINTVTVYNIKTNKWSEAAPMLNHRDQAAAFVNDNKIYVFGGRNEQGIVPSYEYYDIQTNTWTEITNGFDETLLRAGAEIGYADGYLCVIGGKNSTYENMGVDFYDMKHLNTRKQAVLPNSYDYITAAYGEKQLLLFARNYSSEKIDTYKIDLASLTQNRIPVQRTDSAKNLPNTNYAATIMHNGCVYFMGGYNIPEKQYKTEVYRYSVYYGQLDDSDAPVINTPTEKGNTVLLNAQSGKEYLLYINANNIPAVNNKIFTVEFLNDAFALEDGCAFTYDSDTKAGTVAGCESIEIIECTDSKISFQVKQNIQSDRYSAVVNIIKLKAKTDGARKITFYMNDEQ